MKKTVSILLAIVLMISAIPMAVAQDRIITHQPTASEPYVSLDDEEGASYQWHEVKEASQDVTEENAAALDYTENDGGTSVYDAQSGEWSAAVYSKYEYDETQTQYSLDYFDIELRAGESVSVKVNGEILYGYVGLYDYSTGEDYYVYLTDGEATVAVKENGTYTLYLYSLSPFVTVSAVLHSSGVVSDAVEGQTSSVLSDYERDLTYACVVSYADGTVITSEFVKMIPAVTHQPTLQEPYVNVSFADEATYQWYQATDVNEVITDETATPFETPWGVTEYNPQTKLWSTAPFDLDGEYSYSYFRVNLKAGDIVTVESSDEMTEYALYTQNDIEAQATLKGNTIVFTVTQDGAYGLDITTESDTSTIKATLERIVLENALEGANETTLSQSEGTYACKVTYPDGTTLLSDTVTLEKNEQEEIVENTVTVKLNNEFRVGEKMNFDVTVIGNHSRIRFVNSQNETVTLAPENSQVVTITDNANGSVTWNVNLTAHKEEETYSVYAKFADGWNRNPATITVKQRELDISLKSIDIADDYYGAVYQGVSVITVETGTDVIKVQLMENKNTWTYSASNSSYVDVDGVRTWTIRMNFSKLGDHLFDVRIRSANTTFDTVELLDVAVFAR